MPAPRTLSRACPAASKPQIHKTCMIRHAFFGAIGHIVDISLSGVTYGQNSLYANVVRIRGTFQCNPKCDFCTSSQTSVYASGCIAHPRAQALCCALVHTSHRRALCVVADVRTWARARFVVVLYFAFHAQYCRRWGSTPIPLRITPMRALPCPTGRKRSPNPAGGLHNVSPGNIL